MKILTFTVLWVSYLFFSISVNAQITQPTLPPPANDGDIVKISTNLIQIDVTVTDKDGKIVTDLKPEDFEVLENDRKQEISNFSFVFIQQSAENKAENEPIKKTLPGAIAAPPVPTKLKPEQVRRTIALVVDDLGLAFLNMNHVRFLLRKFVDEQMQPNDLVAIIRTGGGVGALQQFTSDKRMLYAAIEKLRWNPTGRTGVSSFAPVRAGLSDEMSGGSVNRQTGEVHEVAGKDAERESAKEIESYREDIFSVGTLGAVNYIIRGMRELPGRKAVMLFSEGLTAFNKDGPNTRVFDSIRRLTDLANRSAVVIYTADPRGLEAPGFTAEDEVTENAQRLNNYADKQLEDRQAKLFDTQQSLQYLARETGGFAVINQNLTSGAIRQMLNDQNGYYLLGYQPDEETFDPKLRRFNRLLVRVKRPGLRVRYRSGFFGITDTQARPQMKTPQQQILAALTAPFATGEINMRLTSLFANDAVTGNFMRSLVHVKGEDLTFTEEADGWHKAVFNVVAMTFGDNGTVVDEVSRTETMRVRPEVLKEVLSKGFVYTVTVPIKKPGAYQMRIVLRDTANSKIGSASQFIEVPNLKKDRLTLSGILLQRLSPQISTEKNTAENRFQSDEQRDVALRRFRAGTKVQFGFAIYNAEFDKATAAPHLTTQVKIFRDGKEMFSSSEKELGTAGQKDLQRILGNGVISLGSQMEADEYVLQVIVRDALAKGKRALATQWIDFEVTK